MHLPDQIRVACSEADIALLMFGRLNSWVSSSVCGPVVKIPIQTHVLSLAHLSLKQSPVFWILEGELGYSG
jgi:hypothetical protein